MVTFHKVSFLTSPDISAFANCVEAAIKGGGLVGEGGCANGKIEGGWRVVK